jgi:soluble P-type ATPase
LTIEIPGRGLFDLRFLLLDVNGTLSDRGELLPGVAERLDELRDLLEPRLLSADTFGIWKTSACSRFTLIPYVRARLRTYSGFA